ncbi:hypothetical protein Enr13x_51450 [Stieleria neptunia]|uniref:Uncharacterized protein n=1 Tax=Stieleria neptunia TaxID=2527979 RepID=A0A518HWN6_9BACT|nr:hypothetical protein [Stieleria neptunia]QDV45270.1 hypothetical protein Enr13x_51450 [Stieleria neptunia]
MAVPPHHFDDEPNESQPGGLLGELERRQDDVLDQLDALDAKLSEVLKGLEPAAEPTGESAAEVAGGDAAARRSALKLALEEDSLEDDGLQDDDDDDFEPAEDWA